MLKIGQNWGKIENYPLNVHQRSAPLPGAYLGGAIGPWLPPLGRQDSIISIE